MKSFIISLILFTILLSFIIFNSLYMKIQSERLIKKAEDLPHISDPTFQEKLSLLRSNWESVKKVIGLSCSYSELLKIDMAFEELSAFATEQSHADCTASKANLIFLLKEISRLERITIEGIF